MTTILKAFGLNAAWIGITDSQGEGSWIDFDGKAFGQGAGSAFTATGGRYENFQGSEPNNQGNEDWTVILSNGRWNDDWAQKPTLCQKPADKGEANSE